MGYDECGMKGEVYAREETLAEVPRAVGQIEDAGSEIHALVQDLESRLSAVVRQEGESDPKTNAVRVGPGCQLAREITEQAGSLQGIALRLRSLLDRLEL